MKKLILTIIVLCLLVIFLPRQPFSDQTALFRVEKGQSSKDIALNLESQKLIWWGPFLRLYVLVTGLSGELQAGTYQFSPSMSLFSLVHKMTSGQVAFIKVTVPEGFSSRKIKQRVEELTGLELGDLSQYEGYLFPDTYNVTYDATGEDVVRMMLDNFDKKTSGLAITPDLITMASLIEKEVQTVEDKAIVSGIFWKRLSVSMPLESCATIAYIKGVDQWRYSYEDTRIESPYNTYLNYGLPPGPIANPGLISIEAALNPQESDYWYWLSTPEGETIFSKTFQEHNAAKAKYLD